LTVLSQTAKIPKSNAIVPYFPLFLGKDVVRNRFNTAHKNRLTVLSNGFLLLYALSNPGTHAPGSSESLWITLSLGRGKLGEFGFQHNKNRKMFDSVPFE
jgi:hypothetical protein